MIDWDELIGREGPAVWRTVFRIVRNRVDADECFQDTFLAALELSQRQPVRNWPALLQKLATSRAIDRVRKQLRRRRREEVVELSEAEGPSADPSQRAQAEELASALRWGLAQLPARQSEVFCLHEFGEWGYQQIAEKFGLSVNAVGVMLHRTRQKLQELLKMQCRMATALKRQRTV